MSAPRFRKQYGLSEELTAMQENIEEVLTPLLDLPFASSVFLEDVPLVSGNNRILHKLERPYRGFVVTSLRPTVPSTGVVYTSVTSSRGDWVNFTPSISMIAGTWTTGTVNMAHFRQMGQTVEVQFTVTGTISGVPGNRVFVVPPVPMANLVGDTDGPYIIVLNANGGSAVLGLCLIEYLNNRLTFFVNPTASNWATGTSQISVSCSYAAASINTLPMPLEVSTTQPQTELVLSSTGAANCDLVIF